MEEEAVYKHSYKSRAQYMLEVIDKNGIFNKGKSTYHFKSGK